MEERWPAKQITEQREVTSYDEDNVWLYETRDALVNIQGGDTVGLRSQKGRSKFSSNDYGWENPETKKPGTGFYKQELRYDDYRNW